MKLSFTLLSLLFCIALGDAQEWVRQNPFGNLSQMYDIDFDGKYGIAVGADATIFTTNNFGATWTQQKPSLLARTIETAFVMPGTFGQLMLAGGDSVIMLSEDGGITWKVSYVEIPNIYKIQVLPGNIIYALGKDFGIYSTDRGKLWQPFNMPAFGATAGDFLSTDKGWVAVGDSGNMKVYYTENRGFNWTIRDDITFERVTGLEMLNDSVGFLSSNEYMYKTLDGGFSWHPLSTISTHYIRDLHVIDEYMIWTSTDDGSIYFTTTAGEIWEIVDPGVPPSNRALGIWANADGKVWTVGKYLTILYSPDFGNTWVDQIPGHRQTLFEPNFRNAFTGMIGGSKGTVFKTVNSGAAWEILTLPGGQNFYGTFMVDDSTAFAASYDGKVYKTINGGETWLTTGTDLGQITDMHAFSSQEIILANKNGDIYKTTNGGTQWTKVHDGQPLLSLTFYNNELGWATGLSGRILNTTDGGNTWNLQYDNFRQEFSDVFFTTNLDGWVTSSKFIDSLWHTTDGGITWESVALPYKTYWQGISFMDRDTGWVVGGTNGEGVIYRTNDQGQTWFLDHVSPDAFMGVFALPNSETAWAVGFGGNIMKFSSCSSPPRVIDIRGTLEPCIGDTINYVVEFIDVDVFDWSWPADWRVFGNANTASIYFIAGEMPGEVSVIGSDACGDTTARLIVNAVPVNIPPVRISEENGFIVTNMTGPGNYEWFFNGVPIAGAHDPFLKPTANGTYQLNFTTFATGCHATSNVFRYGLIPTVMTDAGVLTAYPNPANNFIIIGDSEGRALNAGAKVTLTGLDGRILKTTLSESNQIDIHDLPPGLYSIQVQTEKELLVTKVLVKR